MASDIWFRADVQRILAAVEVATIELERHGVDARYLAGRRAVTQQIAAACGLDVAATRQPDEVIVDALPARGLSGEWE